MNHVAGDRENGTKWPKVTATAVAATKRSPHRDAHLLLLVLLLPRGPDGWVRCSRGKVRPQHFPGCNCCCCYCRPPKVPEGGSAAPEARCGRSTSPCGPQIVWGTTLCNDTMPFVVSPEGCSPRGPKRGAAATLTTAPTTSGGGAGRLLAEPCSSGGMPQAGGGWVAVSAVPSASAWTLAVACWPW